MMNPDTHPAPEGRVHDRTLMLARIGWCAVIAVGVGLVIIGVPIHYAQWQTVCGSSSCGIGILTPQQAQGLQQLGLSMQFWAAYLSVDWILAPLVSVVIAAIIFSRKSDDPMALFTSFVIAVFGLGSAVDFQSASPVLQFLTWLYQGLGSIALVPLIFIFPDGSFVPRWTRWLALLLVTMIVASSFLADSTLNNVLANVVTPLGVVFQLYRYRRVSNAMQRQQTKWVVYGLTVSLIGIGVVSLLAPLFFPPDTAGPLAGMLAFAGITLCLVMIPCSFGIAILRSHLWDIDILIRRTAVYGLVTTLLAGIYFGGVVILQQAFVALTGQKSELAIIASTLAIAVLFVPLRTGIQAVIDRRFYRHKYDAEQALAAFAAVARDETLPDRLALHLLDAVDETVQPERMAIWMKKEK